MLRDWGSWDAASTRSPRALRKRPGRHRQRRQRRTYACRCRAAAPSRSRRRSAPWCRATARCWCRTTAPTARASCRSAGTSAARTSRSTCRGRQPTAAASRRGARGAIRRSRTWRRCTAKPATGILNPLPEIARRARGTASGLIVDAMSSFGAMPIDVRASAVRCAGRRIGQMPRRRARHGLRDRAQGGAGEVPGNSHSLAMDLHDQWIYMEKTTQWRFTPPTHVVAALRAALDQFEAEGGLPARGWRATRELRDADRRAWRALGFRTVPAAPMQAPIIVTFHAPADPTYDFKTSTQDARARLHPLSRQADAGRDLPRRLHRRDRRNEMRNVVSAVAETLKEMGIPSVAPVDSRRLPETRSAGAGSVRTLCGGTAATDEPGLTVSAAISLSSLRASSACGNFGSSSRARCSEPARRAWLLEVALHDAEVVVVHGDVGLQLDGTLELIWAPARSPAARCAQPSVSCRGEERGRELDRLARQFDRPCRGRRCVTTIIHARLL